MGDLRSGYLVVKRVKKSLPLSLSKVNLTKPKKLLNPDLSNAKGVTTQMKTLEEEFLTLVFNVVAEQSSCCCCYCCCCCSQWCFNSFKRISNLARPLHILVGGNCATETKIELPFVSFNSQQNNIKSFKVLK